MLRVVLVSVREPSQPGWVCLVRTKLPLCVHTTADLPKLTINPSIASLILAHSGQISTTRSIPMDITGIDWEYRFGPSGSLLQPISESVESVWRDSVWLDCGKLACVFSCEAWSYQCLLEGLAQLCHVAAAQCDRWERTLGESLCKLASRWSPECQTVHLKLHKNTRQRLKLGCTCSIITIRFDVF